MGQRRKVKLIGGPSDGRWMNYNEPLPKVLVVAEFSKNRLIYHDYERIKDGSIFYKFKGDYGDD